MKAYRTIPRIVAAEQFDPYERTEIQLRNYCDDLCIIIRGTKDASGNFKDGCMISFYHNGDAVSAGSWIVRNDAGLVYIVSDAEFKKQYEEIKD